MKSTNATISLLEQLTGQGIPFDHFKNDLFPQDVFSKGGIGYSQFNEMLLSLGYDRVSRDFFGYLFSLGPRSYPEIASAAEFKAGINKFQIHSLLLYGNVKYGFKRLSGKDRTFLERELSRILPVSKDFYEHRHRPLHDLITIPPEDTYYLGYLAYNQAKRELEMDPGNVELLRKHETIKEIRKMGRRNHDIYLTYDHMDVYVATSMRERHEYYLVNGFVKALFSHPSLAPLNLRYFDPTQAYCEDRLDKGLVEGLMLKRAKCTIYHAQESDTLGKDSELATTLAQGKPVIAYVPRLSNPETFLTAALGLSHSLYPGLARETHLAKLLRLYDQDGAWNDTQVRDWLSGTVPFDEQSVSKRIYEKAQEKYESRARMLSKDHPLGLQMNLTTGVANGVLVVRSVAQCAELLRRILLNEMELTVEQTITDDRVTVLLKESISGCVFRAMTGDELLTNSFWNFYLKDIPYQGIIDDLPKITTQLPLDLTNNEDTSY